MEWIRTHPYATALALAGLLIIAMLIVVENHGVAPSSYATVAWSGPGAIVPDSTTPAQNVSSALPETVASSSAATISYTPPTPSFSSNAQTSTNVATSTDLQALLAELAGPTTVQSSASTTVSANQNIAAAYSYIPQGLVATSTDPSPKMNADQQALYAYGNEIGGIIQSFEETHKDEAQILINQAQDRTDPAKNAALAQLGSDLASVGKAIGRINNAPAEAESGNAALSASYEAIGAKLSAVAGTQTDQQFVSAIETYDSTADTFTKNYVALALLFSAYGVTFSAQDAGSVFSFSDAQGL